MQEQLSNSTTNDSYLSATLLRRLAALVYDTFILFSFIMLATALALLCNQGRSFLPYQYLFLLYLFLSTGLFLTWFWQRSGQTLGMLSWKIKVVDLENKPLTWSKAWQRYFLSFFSVSCCGLGLLWCLFDKNKQSLHDRCSRTKVISTIDIS